MSTITIKSGQVVNRMFLKYSFEEKKSESNDTVTKNSDLPIHKDCHQAYDNLIPHLILLCEQEATNSKIKNAIKNGVIDLEDENSYFKNYKVKEFKISGTANSEGVVISGQRYLSNGKTINLSSPFTRWDDEQYKHIQELIEAVEELREEVLQYYGGKHAPLPKQESFDFEDDDSENPLEKLTKDMKKKGITMEVVAEKV